MHWIVGLVVLFFLAAYNPILGVLIFILTLIPDEDEVPTKKEVGESWRSARKRYLKEYRKQKKESLRNLR